MPGYGNCCRTHRSQVTGCAAEVACARATAAAGSRSGDCCHHRRRRDRSSGHSCARTLGALQHAQVSPSALHGRTATLAVASDRLHRMITAG